MLSNYSHILTEVILFSQQSGNGIIIIIPSKSKYKYLLTNRNNLGLG